MSVRRRSRASSRPSPVDMEVPVDPNTYTWPDRSRKKFVTLVALQCLVTPAPITEEHQINLEIPGLGQKRKLPLKTEREIADHFAFLAAGDGSGAACCIEEAEVSLRFRLAMNEGVPAAVLEGLKAVLREVRKVATGDQVESDIKAAVWANVLELERTKIYADLLERFSRGSRPLSELFQDALGQLETSNNKLTDEEARMVLQKIFDLCTSVTATDKDHCGRDLDRLLDTCYRFRGSRSFKSYLKTVHSRRPLVQIIEKLGRYKTASNSLVAAARKFPDLFAYVEVEAIPQLPILDAKTAAGYRGIYIADVAQDLTQNTEHICMSRLRAVTNLDNAKLSMKYQDLCQAAPIAHAEIQLVKFYEENANVNRPSFIGCSKKACFLCGLFLQLQGRFTVSKAHQNIYHNWSIPTIRCASPENAVMLDFVVEKMNRIIEDSCKKLLWNPTPEEVKLMVVSPMSPGFPSPPTPHSPAFSRPATAASGIYSNLQNMRATLPILQTSLPHVSSKITDSSSDSSSPQGRSPALSPASSCTSVSDAASGEPQAPRPKPQRRRPAEARPQVVAVNIPPARASSRQAKESPARPGSRSLRKRTSPVEVPKAPAPKTDLHKDTADLPVSSFIRTQSVRGARKVIPLPAPARNLPARSPSVMSKAPEIPAKASTRARSSSVMSVRRPVPSSPESVSPRTQYPPGPYAMRRQNTSPAEATRSAIPVPRSVSRTNRKAAPLSEPVFGSAPRDPAISRAIRKPSPAREDTSPPGSPTRSLRRSSPISVARFETATTMAMTAVHGSPTMVELPKPVEAPISVPKPADTTSPSSSSSSSAGGVTLGEASAPASKAVEPVPGVPAELPVEIAREASPIPEAPARIDSMEANPALSPRESEFTEPEPTKRSLSERRGRTLKRVDASPSAPATRSLRSTTDERKKAAIARAAAAAAEESSLTDSAATVEESGLAAQRKRGLSGLAIRKRNLASPRMQPKNYYSDTETLKTSLRGGALTRPRSRLPKLANPNPSETEYTLYLAGPNHDDTNGLGEKFFVGRLSDGQVGDVKQRVGCRLRTQLRPAEKEITGMRVKEVAKSLEEMVLDIFFPDAVLRLEVMWDGVVVQT